MRLSNLGETLRIYWRWGWLSLRDPMQRAVIGRRLKRNGPVTFRMHCPGLGLFAHLNWCLWLAGWAERQGRVCRFECTSPNYGTPSGSLDWLPSVLGQKSSMAASESMRMTVRRWEFLPFSLGSGVPATLAEARSLLSRHFDVPDALVKRSKAFIDAQFGSDFVVGLHYRGTDKHIEAARTTYEDAIASANRACQALQAAGVSSVTIFVATDEERFAEHIIRSIPKVRVVMMDDALRSAGGESIHAVSSNDGLRKAEEAMMDALLLGESRLLIKTASTLSGWAPILGNAMPVVLLSKPFDRCNWFPDAILAECSVDAGREAEAVNLALDQ